MKKTTQLSSSEAEELTALGLHLKQARLRREITQEELASRAGVSRETLRILEAGRGNVSLRTLIAVLQAMSLPGLVSGMLKADPMADEFEFLRDKKRVGGQKYVADF